MNGPVKSLEFVDVWLTPKELSEKIKRSEQALANDRWLGRGFPYTKDGKSVLYHWPTINKTLHERMVHPEE